MCKPMRGVITDNGSPLTSNERLVLNHKAHDFTFVFGCLYSQAILEISGQKVDKLDLIHPRTPFPDYSLDLLLAEHGKCRVEREAQFCERFLRRPYLAS